MIKDADVLETFTREEGQVLGSVSGVMALSALQSIRTTLAASEAREQRLRATSRDRGMKNATE